MQPVLARVGIGSEGLLRDLEEIRRLPALPGQNVMGAGEGEKPPLDGLLGLCGMVQNLRRMARLTAAAAA
jgi:hypothetical protein